MTNEPEPKKERQKLILLAITLFVIAFIAAQLADVIDAAQNGVSTRLILHVVAIIIAGIGAITWAVLRYKEKTKP